MRPNMFLELGASVCYLILAVHEACTGPKRLARGLEVRSGESSIIKCTAEAILRDLGSRYTHAIRAKILRKDEFKTK